MGLAERQEEAEVGYRRGREHSGLWEPLNSGGLNYGVFLHFETGSQYIAHSGLKFIFLPWLPRSRGRPILGYFSGVVHRLSLEEYIQCPKWSFTLQFPILNATEEQALVSPR